NTSALHPTRTPGSAARRRQPGDLMAKCSPRWGHDIPVAVFVSSRPAGARSAAGPQRADPVSADPLAATRTEPAEETRRKPLDPVNAHVWRGTKRDTPSETTRPLLSPGRRRRRPPWGLSP